MGMEFAAANIAAPFTDGVLASTVRDFTCDSTSRANAIPTEWQGRYVLITNETANAAQVLFSKNQFANIDETLAAADDGGPNPVRGSTILGSSSRAMRVPYANPGETIFFVRASAVATTLQVELSS